MSKRKLRLIIISIFILGFLAGNFCEPRYWNKTADIINAQKNEIKHIERLTNIPQMPLNPFILGLDLQGGAHLVYEADVSQIAEEDRDSSLQGLRDVIERRVNMFGVQEPIVQTQETQGHRRLIVELAGIKDISQAIEMIGKTPFLEFRERKDESEVQAILDKRKEFEGKTVEEIQEIEDWQIGLQDIFQPTDLTGKYLKSAEMGFDQTVGEPLIFLQFDDEGSKMFEEITERNINKQLAIYIDGIAISAPVVQQKIAGGNAQITGKFTIDEAKELARNLSAGALPVPITLISQQTVGPVLGEISLQKSLRAGMFGFAAVLLFLILFYRTPGILASISLLIYAALALSLFKIIPVTLTLAGIGGFILSIGMAVDANVLIFSRFREELKSGKSFAQSLAQGFERAWPSIRDGNMTTLIVALILFVFGTSFVKGFALTLGLGILISMFSAIFVTSYLMRMFENTRWARYKWLWK